MAADEARQRLAAFTRNAALANRLVPRLPGEVPNVHRARLLLSALSSMLPAQQAAAVRSQVSVPREPLWPLCTALACGLLGV